MNKPHCTTQRAACGGLRKVGTLTNRVLTDS
jgi:hypothetical protein